jgi:hypothetical protein
MTVCPGFAGQANQWLAGPWRRTVSMFGITISRRARPRFWTATGRPRWSSANRAEASAWSDGDARKWTVRGRRFAQRRVACNLERDMGGGGTVGTARASTARKAGVTAADIARVGRISALRLAAAASYQGPQEPWCLGRGDGG